MTDLTDRMRTCAAHLAAAGEHTGPRAIDDAADLLIEASNALEAIPPPLGEPMEIIEAKPVNEPDGSPDDPGPYRGTWIDPGGALPHVRATRTGASQLHINPRACPTCDSRATKKVVRLDRKLMLVCPVCSAQWEWKKPAG